MGEPERDIETPAPGRRGGDPDQRSGIMIAPDVVKRADAAERVADWIDEEMNDVDLNDQRLNRRLKLILSDLAAASHRQHPGRLRRLRRDHRRLPLLR